jgi:hypothetical protein
MVISARIEPHRQGWLWHESWKQKSTDRVRAAVLF